MTFVLLLMLEWYMLHDIYPFEANIAACVVLFIVGIAAIQVFILEGRKP